MAYGEITETKVVQALNTPEAIRQKNEFYARFLWNVQNVQVSYTKDNLTDEVSSYATITYQRSKLLPHYSELVALENEFMATIHEAENIKASIEKGTGFSFVKTFFLGLAVLVGAFIPFSIAYEGGNPLLTTIWYWILGGIMFLVGLGLLIHSREMHKEGLKSAEALEPNLQQTMARIQELQTKADTLRQRILYEVQ